VGCVLKLQEGTTGVVKENPDDEPRGVGTPNACVEVEAVENPGFPKETAGAPGPKGEEEGMLPVGKEPNPKLAEGAGVAKENGAPAAADAAPKPGVVVGPKSEVGAGATEIPFLFRM